MQTNNDPLNDLEDSIMNEQKGPDFALAGSDAAKMQKESTESNIDQSKEVLLKKEATDQTDAPKVKKRIQFDAEVEMTESKKESAKAIDNKPAADFGGYASRRQRKYDDDQSQDEDEDYVQSEAPEMSYVNTQGQTVSNKPNPRFKNYSNVFKNLVKSTNVVTMYPIVSMIITYDSSKAVTVTKRNDREYYIKQYDLETYDLTFEEKIGGGDDQYIKLKEVEQSYSGKKYACVYNDDGKFYIRSFKKETRAEADIVANEQCFNDLLNLDNHTMCIQTFSDPFINCCFVTDDVVYVQLFHNATLTHYHFLYNLETKKIEGEVVSLVLTCTKKNFPYKCFYNEERDEIYGFYRQGQSFIVNAKDVKDYAYDRMTEMDLGQMYLVYNSSLVARSSSDILFFKIEKDEETGDRSWKLYHTEEVRGFIYYIRGNVRIQIVTDDKIRFYLMDKDTLMPILENVMFNFMTCNNMMYGSKVRYCVTYKTNQKSFDIYRRKYLHDFKVPILNENLEGSICLELTTMNNFLVSKIDKIIMYDCETFEELDQVPIQLLKADTREPNQVIAMTKSQDEEYLAVISGKILIMNEQKTNQLFIFKKERGQNGEIDKYVQCNRVVLKEIEFFKQVCMEFHFKPAKNGVTDTIIFAKIDCIFEMNFKTDVLTTIFQFTHPLKRQPLYFVPNFDQTIYTIASPEDGFHINLTKSSQKETNISKHYEIDAIKEVIYDGEENQFYILSNKFEEKLGFFILKISEKNPMESQFLIKWKNKLDIGDPNIYVLRNKQKGLKELIVSYKTIFINTYNVIVMDISVNDEQTMIFRHESFQLWESECMGLLLGQNKDYITVNKQGMQVLSLGSTERRAIKDSQGFDRMIHSLESVNFLKLDSNNYVLFECAKPEARIISIDQEYIKGDSSTGVDEASFWPLYKVKLHEITLRELMLFQSLYVCKTLSEIIDIVNDQPNPAVFYKSFFELDGSNMVSILSFDSRSMGYLLQDDFSSHFSKQFPLFYRNKIQKGQSKDSKYFYRSAIDSALRNNQVRAVSIIIEYVVKYQNNFIYSYLFNKNFPVLLEKGIEVKPLLDSNIFVFNFDLDEWPSSHFNPDWHLRAFNENIFMIRKHYRTVFPEEEFDPMGDDDSSQKSKKYDSSKVYKIKYSINMLPYIGMYLHKDTDPYTKEETREMANEDVNLLGLCSESDELEMFGSESLQDCIEFKWAQYGQNWHFMGFFLHLVYIIILIMYTDFVYIKKAENVEIAGTDGADALPGTAEIEVEHNDDDSLRDFSIVLLAGIIYPLVYETVQMFKGGIGDYLSDAGNYIDLLYIWGSVAMSVIHIVKGPYEWYSKALMIIVVILAIRRTFSYLRIFKSLSPIVTMLQNVIWDLRVFLTFYVILTLLFSLMYGVLGLGNSKIPGGFRDTYFTPTGQLDSGAPGIEYDKIGLFFGNFIQTIRLSMGDFAAIDAANTLSKEENYVFWIVWFVTVVVTCIVFLNFIVAEASASYTTVSEQLGNYIQQQRADLTAEAEGLLCGCLQTDKTFPKYILIRKTET